RQCGGAFMRAVMFGLAVSLCLATPASADYLMTGEELYGACTNSAEMPVCLAYVSGVADEITHMNELVNVFEQVQEPDSAPIRCIRARLPAALSAASVRDVFL